MYVSNMNSLERKAGKTNQKAGEQVVYIVIWETERDDNLCSFGLQPWISYPVLLLPCALF